MQINFKSWLPHILAIALFLIIPVIYFLPVLDGKALLQGDITNFFGVVKELVDFRAKYHTEALWTNSEFGGMPAYQISVAYPANLIQYIFKFLLHIVPFPASTVFLYCLGFYILMNVLKIDRWVAIVSSFAFAFSSFFFIAIAAGHNSQANTIAFMAPTLAGVILAFNGKRLLGGALTAISFALELYASHLQMTYYLAIMILIYGIIQLILAVKSKQLPDFFKTVGVLIIAVVLAASTNTTNLWLTYKYGKLSTRGTSDLTINQQNKSSGLAIDYATDWSYSVPETMTLMIPNYVGGASDPIGQDSKSALEGIDPQFTEAVAGYSQYWGNQRFTSGPVYAGAIVCFLALLGLFFTKGPMKWFLFSVTVLAILLSWGRNFMWFTELFFYHFPGYNKFRNVYWTLIMVEFTLPILAALAVDHIIKNPSFFDEKISLRFFKNAISGKRIFFASLILTGGITLLCYIMPGTFSNFHKDNEIENMVQEYKQGNPNLKEEQIQTYLSQLMPYVEQARKKVFTADAGRSTIFILLSAGLLWVYYKKWADKKVILAVLLFFILMDMYNVDKRYLNDRNFTTRKAVDNPFQRDQADQQILQDSSLDYRVFNTTTGLSYDSRTSYFHKSLGGYSGVKMKRYDDILSFIQEGNMPIINMLNTKYFIVGGREGEKHAERNPGALGNAWFVNNYKVVPSADSEYMNITRFNPKETAIVNQKFAGDLPAHLSPDSTAQIKMVSYLPNDLVYTTQSHAQELAVFSEIYYKDGWDAFIDGVPSNYIQTNYILRAMVIPAGTHKVEFKFEPKEYAEGEKVSLAGSLILLFSCLSIFLMQFMKPKE